MRKFSAAYLFFFLFEGFLPILTLHSPDLHYFPNNCLACHNSSQAGAPTLYSIHRTDGAGGSLSLMLIAMGIAQKKGWNYGGALGPRGHLSWNHNNQVSEPSL